MFTSLLLNVGVFHYANGTTGVINVTSGKNKRNYWYDNVHLLAIPRDKQVVCFESLKIWNLGRRD